MVVVVMEARVMLWFRMISDLLRIFVGFGFGHPTSISRKSVNGKTVKEGADYFPLYLYQ